MALWQALIVAAVPSVAAIVTALVGFRDFRLRRRLETSRQFLTLFASANGRPVDGREFVGEAEQIATIHLIADFAATDRILVNAAREGLAVFAAWATEDDDMSRNAARAAAQALRRLR